MISLQRKSLLCAGRDLVNISARLKSDFTLNGIVIPDATLSLTLWKHTELCFLVRRDSAMLAFLKTESLSQNTLALPCIGMPSILSLYLNEIICSTANLNATNSLPNVDDLTVDCFLEYQDIGALFR